MLVSPVPRRSSAFVGACASAILASPPSTRRDIIQACLAHRVPPTSKLLRAAFPPFGCGSPLPVPSFTTRSVSAQDSVAFAALAIAATASRPAALAAALCHDDIALAVRCIREVDDAAAQRVLGGWDRTAGGHDGGASAESLPLDSRPSSARGETDDASDRAFVARGADHEIPIAPDATPLPSDSPLPSSHRAGAAPDLHGKGPAELVAMLDVALGRAVAMASGQRHDEIPGDETAWRSGDAFGAGGGEGERGSEGVRVGADSRALDGAVEEVLSVGAAALRVMHLARSPGAVAAGVGRAVEVVRDVAGREKMRSWVYGDAAPGCDGLSVPGVDSEGMLAVALERAGLLGQLAPLVRREGCENGSSPSGTVGIESLYEAGMLAEGLCRIASAGGEPPATAVRSLRVAKRSIMAAAVAGALLRGHVLEGADGSGMLLRWLERLEVACEGEVGDGTGKGEGTARAWLRDGWLRAGCGDCIRGRWRRVEGLSGTGRPH